MPSHRIPLKNSKGETPSPHEMFSILHEHFVHKPTNADWNPQSIDELIMPIPAREWHEITTAEIGAILKTTKARSAPGKDHIPWTLLKKILDHDTLVHIAKIFNALISSSNLTPALKSAVTVVIPKPNKADYTKPKAWHPIVLLTCLSKLLMGVIAKQHNARAHSLLHPNQYGGIEGCSAIDAVLLFTQKAHDARYAGMFTLVLAVDIAQFFPSVQPHIVVEIYKRQGFPKELVNFLGSYLSDRCTTYKIGDANSTKFEVQIGIPQGCKICPIAACLYIMPALKMLTPWDPEARQFHQQSCQDH